MKTTQEERESFGLRLALGPGHGKPPSVSDVLRLISDARELARLREGLEKLERVEAAAPLTGVAELAADPNGEAVLWSDVLALLHDQ